MKIITNYRIQTLTSFTILLLSIFLIFACGPKPGKIKPNTPYNLQVVSKSHGAFLSWQINRVKGVPVGGYNIYLADSPESPGKLYNSGPYPGDTDGDITRESIELMRLTNGKIYYVYINTVLNGGKLSTPSARVKFIPLSQGSIKISPNHSTSKSGYSFIKEKLTAARDFDNDFYIYATADKIGISSPSRLHSSLRKTLIKIESNADSKFSQTQLLVKGKTYILRTADGGNAHLTFTRLIGDKPSLTAVFDYIYYPPGVKP